MTVELAHHEVGSAGQCEIGVKYNSLVKKADEIMMFKYMVKEVAREYDYVATFMPKPLHGDNGSGMHCHQSIWNADGSGSGYGNRFAGNGSNPGYLSQTALYYTGGILKHARALTALTNPTTNSYKRLVPGYEAPNVLAYSSRNRSTAIRIPASNNCKGRRIEVRFPDPSCNPYLAFAAMLMAGIDGIKNKIDPGDTLDKDAFSMSDEELAKYPGELPGSLDEALVALSGDHEFLTADNVFTWDLIKTWIEYKYDNEVDNVRTYPHPREFELYFDV
jgi:glutamine synthetase